MPTARSSPQAATAAWWNSAPPASRKPPLRPAAPPAIGPASIPTTVAPASSARTDRREPGAAEPDDADVRAHVALQRRRVVPRGGVAPDGRRGGDHARHAASAARGRCAAAARATVLPGAAGGRAQGSRVRPGVPLRVAVCRSSRRPAGGRSRRPTRPVTTGCSRSAPISRPARCWPRTARGSSRCRWRARASWRGSAPTRAGSCRSASSGPRARCGARRAASRSRRTARSRT